MLRYCHLVKVSKVQVYSSFTVKDPAIDFPTIFFSKVQECLENVQENLFSDVKSVPGDICYSGKSSKTCFWKPTNQSLEL